NVMKMGAAAARPMPELIFENCFIRGRGALLAVRSSRPFDLRLDNCIAAITGPLCNIEASTAKGLPGASAQITLNKVSCAIAGNFLQRHTAKEGKDLVPVAVRASESVFQASDGQPLVYVDGALPQIKDRNMAERNLSWRGQKNVYLGFKQFLDQKAEEMGFK